MFRSLRLLPLAALPLLLGASLPIQRPVEKILTVDVDPVSFGLVEVQVDEDVNQKAPSDFANMSGLISSAADRCVNRAGSGATFKNLTDLGYQSKWSRAATSTEPIPWVASPVEGLPNGVDTALVTSIKVIDWRTFTIKDPDTKLETNAAKVTLVMTTRSKSGADVLTQLTSATVKEGLNGESVSIAPNWGLITDWATRADGRKVNELLSKERKVLMERAVEDAVCVHYYPFMPHTIFEGLNLLGGKDAKPGIEKAKAGDYDGAIAEFEKWAAADPSDDTPVFDIGSIWYSRGDTAKAREYLTKANAIKKTGLTTQMLNALDFYDKMKRSVSVQ